MRLSTQIDKLNLDGPHTHARAWLEPSPGCERGLALIIQGIAEVIEYGNAHEDRTLRIYLETTIDGADSLVDKDVGRLDPEILALSLELCRAALVVRQ